MTSLLHLFENNLLPVFLAAGSGYLLGQWLDIDSQSISRVVFYLFSPCLVFKLLTNNELASSDIFHMAGFAIVNMVLLGAIVYALGRLWRLERRLLVAMVLTSTLTNAGNFGLSVNLFAFGEDALAHASLYFVTSAIMVYSAGVVVASLGRASLRDSLLSLLKVPAVYGLILAMLFIQLDWKLPLFLERTVSVLSEAAIPGMLVLLGLQLRQVRWTNRLGLLSITNIFRLVIGPALAFFCSWVFHLQGSARQAGIMEASMPTAVMTTVLATEFDIEPSFVTSVVFTTTLLSPLTLTPLMALLGG
ncbi:MAG: AEC family transporter [Chloroflexota bacterium]